MCWTCSKGSLSTARPAARTLIMSAAKISDAQRRATAVAEPCLEFMGREQHLRLRSSEVNFAAGLEFSKNLRVLDQTQTILKSSPEIVRTYAVDALLSCNHRRRRTNLLRHANCCLLLSPRVCSADVGIGTRGCDKAGGRTCAKKNPNTWTSMASGDTLLAKMLIPLQLKEFLIFHNYIVNP